MQLVFADFTGPRREIAWQSRSDAERLIAHFPIGGARPDRGVE